MFENPYTPASKIDSKVKKLNKHLKAYKPKNARAMSNFLGIQFCEATFAALMAPIELANVKEDKQKERSQKWKRDTVKKFS